MCEKKDENSHGIHEQIAKSLPKLTFLTYDLIFEQLKEKYSLYLYAWFHTVMKEFICM